MATAPLVAPALLLAPLAAARLASEADCVTVTVRASPPAPDEAEGCKVMVMRTPEEAVSITVAVTGSREDVAEEEEEEAASEEDEAEARQDGGDCVSPEPSKRREFREFCHSQEEAEEAEEDAVEEEEEEESEAAAKD